MLFTRFLCPESLAACVLILCPGTKRGNCVAPFCARAQNEARSWAQNGGGHKTRVGRKSRNQKKDTSMQARLCARAQNGDRLSSSGVDLSCRAARAPSGRAPRPARRLTRLGPGRMIRPKCNTTLHTATQNLLGHAKCSSIPHGSTCTAHRCGPGSPCSTEALSRLWCCWRY